MNLLEQILRLLEEVTRILEHPKFLLENILQLMPIKLLSPSLEGSN